MLTCSQKNEYLPWAISQCIQVPSVVHVLDALPVTGSGKVLKTALRDQYRTPARAARATRPPMTSHPTAVQASCRSVTST